MQQGRDLPGQRREDVGPVLDGHGVQIDDAEDLLVAERGAAAGLRLAGDPAPHRPHVVAEVHLARGLDAREHACHSPGTLPAEAFPGALPGWAGGAYDTRVIRSGSVAAMSYEVQTPVFEGPFDLLLHLILKQEVDLWEISLSSIVDAFVAEVEKLDRVDLDRRRRSSC